jgi:hypothetical protein
MSSIGLFPILVCDYDYPDHDAFKKTFFSNIEKYITPFDGGTQDESGTVVLHLNKELQPFYTFVATCAKDYVKELGVDPSEWAYHLVKSWWNANEKSNIPEHDHSDAHISFVYYLNAPPQSNKLVFMPQHYHPNDLTNGLFQDNYAGETTILNRNQYNSSPAFDALEGNLIIFPGRLKHATISLTSPMEVDDTTRDPKILKQRRISISGDFLMTFKDPNNRRSLGLQPMANWIRFV